jgi:tetratricopeptide (TPR) repeat protein
MKANLIFLAAMAITVFATGQNQNEFNENVVTNPAFSCNGTLIQGNSFESVDEFLLHFIEYPYESVTCNRQGTEVVSFVVTPQGELTDIKIVNSVCPKIDEELIRVLGLTSGKWQAGTVNGINVPMEKEISVAFKMYPSNDFKKLAQNSLNKGNDMKMKGNLKKAAKFYTEAINYLPNEKTILAARSVCKYEMGDIKGAEQDWARLQKIGFFESSKPVENDLIVVAYK